MNLTVTLEGDASIQNATYTWSGPGINAANANEQTQWSASQYLHLTVNDQLQAVIRHLHRSRWWVSKTQYSWRQLEG
ncbi:MAG: hypothetical protein R2825_27845 [Saprospiraceae bacterium]